MIGYGLATGAVVMLASAVGIWLALRLQRQSGSSGVDGRWWRLAVGVVVATAFAVGPIVLGSVHGATEGRAGGMPGLLVWLGLVVATLASPALARPPVRVLPFATAWIPAAALVAACALVAPAGPQGLDPFQIANAMMAVVLAVGAAAVGLHARQGAAATWRGRSAIAACSGLGCALVSVAFGAGNGGAGSAFPVPGAHVGVAMLAGLTAVGCVYTSAVLLGLVVRDIRQETADLSASLACVSEDIFDLEHRDPVTRLQNRSQFLGRIQHRFEAAATRRSLVAVIVVNVDGIGMLNESFGANAGDDALRVIAGRLLARTSDESVSRLDGKEFAFLFDDFQDVAELVERMAGLMDALSEPMVVDDEQVLLSVSAGIAIHPCDGDGPLPLKRARQAMQRAMKSGRRQICLFDAALDRGASHNPGMEARLHRALANREFMLYLQPKCEPRSGRIVGAEALLRWDCPGQAATGPAEFIAIAERCGLIKDIGWFVIEEACRLLHHMRDHGILLPLSVNLSPAQFADPALLSRLCDVLARYSVSPGSLCLEVTEGMAVDNPEQMRIVLAAMRGLGFRVAMDDFGTGYSSLSKLVSLPVDELKIDRAFIIDIEKNLRSRSIVEAVVRLGRACGCVVVVEGIETAAQAALVTEFGVDQVQGFYWYRPMPFAQFLDAVQVGEAKAGEAKALTARGRSLTLVSR